MEMTTMTLKVQHLTKLEDGTQIRAGWYVTTPFCPEVVFATEQEALAYGAPRSYARSYWTECGRWASMSCAP
jgi:hypothetical protein